MSWCTDEYIDRMNSHGNRHHLMINQIRLDIQTRQTHKELRPGRKLLNPMTSDELKKRMRKHRFHSKAIAKQN